MDKASVLGDVIKYVKHLQQRLKTLEEQETKKMVESVVLVKRFRVSGDGRDISSSVTDESCSDQLLPEVEARALDKDVLIRIRCEKQQGGNLVKILGEVKKLQLLVVNTSVLQFGNSFDITIVAQVRAYVQLFKKSSYSS